MSSFLTIIELISPNSDLYTVPFLNFEYGAKSKREAITQKNLTVFNTQIETVSEEIQTLEKRKNQLNKEALSRILTIEESKELEGIFTKINKNKKYLENLMGNIDRITQ